MKNGSPKSAVEAIKALTAPLSLEKFAVSMRADFRFAPLNVLKLEGVFEVGLVIHLI